MTPLPSLDMDDASAESAEIARLVLELSTVTRRAFKRPKRAVPLASQEPAMPITPAAQSSDALVTTKTGSPVRTNGKRMRRGKSIDSQAFGSPSVRHCRRNFSEKGVPCTPTFPSSQGAQKRFVAVRKCAVRSNGYGTVLRSREMREDGDLFADDKSVQACVARRVVEHGVGRPENENVSPLSFLLDLPGWNLVCERVQCPLDDRETVFDQLECAPADILELLERNFVSVGCKNIPASIKPSLILEECIRAEASKRLEDLETIDRRKERLRSENVSQYALPSKENSYRVLDNVDRGKHAHRAQIAERAQDFRNQKSSASKRGGDAGTCRRKRLKKAFDTKRELLTDIQSISEHLLTDREFALASIRAGVRQHFLEQKIDTCTHLRAWLDLISLTNDTECIGMLRLALEQNRIPREQGMCCSLILAFQKNAEALQFFDHELPDWPFSSKDAPTIAVALLENHLPLPKCVTAKLPMNARASLSPKARMWLARWQADMKFPAWQDLEILTTLLETAALALQEPFLPNPFAARLSNIEKVNNEISRLIVEVVTARRKIQPDTRSMLALAVRSNATLLLDACLAASSLELVESLPSDVQTMPDHHVGRSAFERMLTLFEELKETKLCHWEFLHRVCAHVSVLEDMVGKPAGKDDFLKPWIQLLHRCPSPCLLLNIVRSLEKLSDDDLRAPTSGKMRSVSEMLTEMIRLLSVAAVEDNFETIVQKALESNVKTKRTVDCCRRKLHDLLQRGYKITVDPGSPLDASGNFYGDLIHILKRRRS